MSRSAPIIPVNAKMYRHFAIATVMITGTLALFADGENREALEEQIEARQQTVALKQAEQENAAKKATVAKSNFTDKRKTKGSFGREDDYEWRPPRLPRRGGGFAEEGEAELVAASDVSYSGGPVSNPGAAMKAPPPPGMSPEQYEQMLNQKKKRKPQPVSTAAQRQMTAAQQQAMLAASDARSRTMRVEQEQD